MQNILLIINLLLCATFCPAQTYTQESLCHSVRKAIKEDIYSDNDYTDSGACLPSYGQHLKYDLGYFAKVMLVVDDRIDSIVIDGSLVTIWADYRKGFAREGGRENIYNQFHDIYSSLFSFDEVQTISVFDCWDDCRNITYLPMKTDEPLIVMEGAKFYRRWYIPDVDYFDIVGEESFSNKEYYNENNELLGEILEIKVQSHITDPEREKKDLDLPLCQD
ncbi:MAG: hypothetical protein LUE26_06440 [Alistipes sp.]|nr:hypothetical protein [Alistipes sp.]